jgi:hypothetical protein
MTIRECLFTSFAAFALVLVQLLLERGETPLEGGYGVCRPQCNVRQVTSGRLKRGSSPTKGGHLCLS